MKTLNNREELEVKIFDTLKLQVIVYVNKETNELLIEMPSDSYNYNVVTKVVRFLKDTGYVNPKEVFVNASVSLSKDPILYIGGMLSEEGMKLEEFLPEEDMVFYE